MSKAARAIIIENGAMLVMHRNKQGDQYYTLVGGRANEDEPLEQTLVREIKEETGLEVTAASLVFFEDHPAPYNQQYIYLCRVAPHPPVALQTTSEEHAMNRLGFNTHNPVWIPLSAFERLPFRTPQLQQAILKGYKKGFPQQPLHL